MGCSGTGKGTTVEKLSSQLPNTVTWSNGNVFRSVTLLAATWSEQNGHAEFNAAAALTAENLKNFMGMLSFDAAAMDIKINGLGLDHMVNDIKNTELKGAKVRTRCRALLCCCMRCCVMRCCYMCCC